MQSLMNLAGGFQGALEPMVLLYCFIGVLSGIIIGALPGLGPSTGIAILLPLTYGMNPTAGIVMLAGIYYGAMYGGSITSILINTPGDSAAVVTAFDGHPMAKNGRPDQALGMAAFASVIGGTIALIGFVFLAPIISTYALVFSSTEYAALYVMGLTAIAGMTGKSVAKAFMACMLGLFVGTIGLDAVNGTQRFVFGITPLYSGIDFIPVAMGLFGVAEMIAVRDEEQQIQLKREDIRFRKLLPSKEDWHFSLPHIFRGSILGFFVGILPGAGATIATFLSYDLARRTGKRKDKFGTGIPEGIAAPESSNNAACIGAMIPMLTLGVPGSGATAVMMGALLMFEMTPGPFLFQKNGEFAWSLCASLYVANIIMLILVIFALPLFIQIIKVKGGVLNSVVMGFILVGAYAMNNSLFDVGIVIFFGGIGYLFKKLEIPAAPMILALVLGNNLEVTFRQGMTLVRGNIFSFISRPITAVIFLAAVGLAFGKPIHSVVKKISKK